ncbi:hypothetical protein EV360DRAFT_80988 [Lentinula raphanica]|nr:hypothetical protein EV360DRAFT_80988 [Lentinula raphanica]
MRLRTFGFAYFLLGSIVALRAAPLVAKINQIGGSKEVRTTPPDLSDNPSRLTERSDDTLNGELQPLLAQTNQAGVPGGCCSEPMSKGVRTTAVLSNNPSRLTERSDDMEPSMTGDFQSLVAPVPSTSILVPRGNIEYVYVYKFKPAGSSESIVADFTQGEFVPSEEMVLDDRKARAQKYFQEVKFPGDPNVQVVFLQDALRGSRNVRPQKLGAPFAVVWGHTRNADELAETITIPEDLGTMQSVQTVRVIVYALYGTDHSQPGARGIPTRIRDRVNQHFEELYPAKRVIVEFHTESARYDSADLQAPFRVRYRLDGDRVIARRVATIARLVGDKVVSRPVIPPSTHLSSLGI